MTIALQHPLTAAAPLWHRAGDLEVRLAQGSGEIAAAQRLRYQVFYEEMGAHAGDAARASGTDADDYDALCDHLLVIDHAGPGRPQVVGTYRLLRQDVAEAHRGFYSAGEFDLAPLLAQSRPGAQLLELGRSCVAPAFRTSATISLLWRGIASYLSRHGIGHLFGCASLYGTDPMLHAAELSYLFQNHLAPPELRARALPPHRVELNRLPSASIDVRATQRALPPLVRGYLRVGAMVGDGAFVDYQFNTVDVFVVMPVDRITSRYAARFGAAAN
ncbi:GNAT family N-acyltransferase [Sandarakinorhabdus sp.]|uniref:GNAT family N-acetyltransferase n=1 Tax=Sandarakinorhabdus sp. TaxID=1916663 RepID=UPI00286DB921|nr:GNAT family N-acyltransferase [Sandarakinorhabdus sp.]